MRTAHETLLFVLCGALLLVAIVYIFKLPLGYGHTLGALVADSQDVGTNMVAPTNTDNLSDTGSTNNASFSTTTYRYKITNQVDPCSLNTLGTQGWKVVNYGIDPNTSSGITTLSGKNENCQNDGIYQGIPWAVFELSTSSTANTVTTDTATARQYRIVQNVDPCILNALGAQGWRATQFGDQMNLTGSSDETCKRMGVYPVINWVIFERPISSPTAQ